MDTGPIRLSIISRQGLRDIRAAWYRRDAVDRCRDLVDLVAIVLAAPVEADPQLTALRSEAERRGLQLPGRFAVPDRGLWQSGYAAEAGRSLLPKARTLDEDNATVTPFLDPLLAGTARGRWDPQNARWTA